jgi:hypothetical protein
VDRGAEEVAVDNDAAHWILIVIGVVTLLVVLLRR